MTPSEKLRLAHRIARRFLAQTKCLKFLGGDRREVLPKVWEMYERTYATLGKHISSPQELLKYDQWEVCVDSQGNAFQFTLMSKTPYGFKAGLSGHDGSSEGKRLAVEKLKERFRTPGYFGEVSHKVKAIALETGAPAVCSAYAEEILQKPVLPLEDGLEYQRSLPGVGMVTKMLVGKPRGIPLTNAKHPSCPSMGRQASFEEEAESDDWCGADSHYACLAFDIESD